MFIWWASGAVFCATDAVLRLGRLLLQIVLQKVSIVAVSSHLVAVPHSRLRELACKAEEGSAILSVSHNSFVCAADGIGRGVPCSREGIASSSVLHIRGSARSTIGLT